MIDVGKLLDRLGLEYKIAGDDYIVKCWHHPESKPSMFINIEGGFYHCFSCHSKGNLFTLLWDHLNISGLDAVEYLNQFDKGGFTDEEMRVYLENTIRNRSLSNQPIEINSIELPKHEKITQNDYLKTRGITPRDMISLDIGIITGYPYNNWIIIPIYFKGILRNYFLRSPNSNRKLYGKYDISDILFGLDSADNFSLPLCLSEGIFDMLFLRKAGLQSSAILSNRLLPEKRFHLKSYSEIVIFPDNDENEAGLHVIEDSQNLLRHTKVSVAVLPKGINDPGDCWNKLYILRESYNNRISLENFLISDRYTEWLLSDKGRKLEDK